VFQNFSYRFSYNLHWHFLRLSRPQFDILRDLFEPLTASKTSQGLYTLTASKALSRPLQFTSTLKASEVYKQSLGL
jgi:hypothetical protein